MAYLSLSAWSTCCSTCLPAAKVSNDSVRTCWLQIMSIPICLNWFDFPFADPKIFGVIRVLRLLRALRPLRVINRAPGVKLVVMTLISSLKPIGNIVLICCTFFIIFGILGVQLFKGMMFHCVGPAIVNVTDKAECLEQEGNKWVNQRYNFDNLGQVTYCWSWTLDWCHLVVVETYLDAFQALMSLFVLSSKDGWVSIMYQGIDATGVDMQVSYQRTSFSWLCSCGCSCNYLVVCSWLSAKCQ